MCCDKSMTLLFGTEIVFYLESFCISLIAFIFECRFFSNEVCFYDFFSQNLNLNKVHKDFTSNRGHKVLLQLLSTAWKQRFIQWWNKPLVKMTTKTSSVWSLCTFYYYCNKFKETAGIPAFSRHRQHVQPAHHKHNHSERCTIQTTIKTFQCLMHLQTNKNKY